MKTAKADRVLFLIGACMLVILMVLILSRQLQDRASARARHQDAIAYTERFWEDHDGR